MTTHLQKLAISSIFLALIASPAFAKKSESHGNSGKIKVEHRKDVGHSGGKQHASVKINTSQKQFFNDNRLTSIRNYYSQTFRAGNCPPGLAKKNNGCQPPGQAKKWRKGYRLPADVVYYDLPTSLLHELGRTPEGQKIVRVGTDILLISVGTGMVIDAIDDLRSLF